MRTLIGAAAILCLAACGGGDAGAARSLPKAVAYQVDAAHTGHIDFGTAPTFPSAPTWSVSLGGAVSYPLIAEGKVFVLVGTQTGTQLLALDQATGGTVWGPISVSTAAWAGHTYSRGQIVVIGREGLLQSFDATTGNRTWSKKLGVARVFSAAPTAADGVIYVSAGRGNFADGEFNGMLAAIDDRNGNIIWQSVVFYGDISSPAVSDEGVFVSYSGQYYGFNRNTGAETWHVATVYAGEGGKTPAVANGRVFVRDVAYPPGVFRDARTGEALGAFADHEFDPPPIPAFKGSSGFLMNYGVLQRMDSTLQSTEWSFAGDGQLVSAPIVVDSAVIVASASSRVYALDNMSGALLWTGQAASGVVAADETLAAVPLTGLAAGEGYLLVPAGSTLTAWRIVPR